MEHVRRPRRSRRYTRSLTVRVSTAILRALEREAKRQQATVGDVVRDALARYGAQPAGQVRRARAWLADADASGGRR
jgi:predicted transcriptional regulator